MVRTIEELPNEILLRIFSYISWFDMLTSFWSLNIRFNSLICSTLSINDHFSNSGLIITRGSSYSKGCSILFPLVLNSSSLCSSIQRIHLDGRNSSAPDVYYQWLFDQKNLFCFPNLKTFILTQCGSIESAVPSLLYLIEYQLDNLTLTFNHHELRDMLHSRWNIPTFSEREIFKKKLGMLEELICKLFSGQCQLKSLRLDISSDPINWKIHQCLKSYSNLSPKFVQYKYQSSCLTLRHLCIRLNHNCFLENVIEHVPNLEKLYVEFVGSLDSGSSRKLDGQTTTNWFDNLPNLRHFSLKTFINIDAEFLYLKWLLNNLNYIEKLQLHIKKNKLDDNKCQNLWKCLIDANFVRQYCLPDLIPNLIELNFYICSEAQLSFNDIEIIENSFQMNPFFLKHRWTNVICLFDSIMSCQHLFSCFNNTSSSSSSRINGLNIFNWSNSYYRWFNLYPSVHFFLDQFNQLSSKISSLNIYKKYTSDVEQSDLQMSLEVLSKMKANNKIAMPFRNVTKIQFGTPFDRKDGNMSILKDQNEICGKVLAHLISMTVQLKYLIVQRFEWLLHAVQYIPNEMRVNALSTVQYTEFQLPSCHYGDNEIVSVGKHLVPFLSTYMPHLQTLRLWRPDDFPWTSIRPRLIMDCYRSLIYNWVKSLRKPKSIVKHVNVFEQDLSQLVKNLKELTFIDIFGDIYCKKIEPYRLMAQSLFPHSHVDVQITRFRLWL